LATDSPLAFNTQGHHKVGSYPYSPDKAKALLADYGAAKTDDLLSSIGYGKLSAKQIVARLLPDGTSDRPPDAESRLASAVKKIFGIGGDAKLKVTGFDELLTYRAKCCNPIRGEEIIGYITRGKGVAVHSKNCPNVQNLMYDSARKIEVEWAGVSPAAEAYAVPLTIMTENRTGMLAEIAAAVADVGSNIVNAEARAVDGRGFVDLVVEIPDKKHLEKVIASIQRIGGVFDVTRSARTVNQVR